jgi:hypothetical protein
MGERQHTVPRTYLRGFSDPKERLRAFDRVKQQRLTVTVTNATVKKNIYDLPSVLASSQGLDPQTIEKWLPAKESAAAGPLEEIRSGRSAVQLAYHDVLREFIALQLTRTIRRWEEMNDLADWYGRTMLEGISRQEVEERLREPGADPTEEDIRGALEFADRIDDFEFHVPQIEFLRTFLGVYEDVLPHLATGWNWVVVWSDEPFLSSDHPVGVVGDSLDGGLGVEDAEEIWLPVGRHRALVLSKDFSLPPVVFGIPVVHARRICQRIALESHRWVFWHPKDDPLRGFAPQPRRKMETKTIGLRKRPDGLIEDFISFSSGRPVIRGECLLNGRPVLDQKRVPFQSPGPRPPKQPPLEVSHATREELRDLSF